MDDEDDEAMILSRNRFFIDFEDGKIIQDLV